MTRLPGQALSSRPRDSADPSRTAFLPKTFTVLRGYTAPQLAADLEAGVVVGIVAVPLALAFATASGVAPEKGLVTAVVVGFLISFLGGSRVHIGGATGAFVVIVYGIVQKYGIDGLHVCMAIAGLLLIGMGLARFGGAIKFIPYPVVTGFTSGIALIIFSSEVKDLLGLRMGAVPASFLEKWAAIARASATVSPAAIAVSVGSLAILILWPRVSKKVPAPIVAILVSAAAVAVLRVPIETIGSRFGAFPAGIPAPRWPSMTAASVRELFSPALTRALLAAIESLLSAVVADEMIGSLRTSSSWRRASRTSAPPSSAGFPRPARSRERRRASRTAAGLRSPG